MQRLFNVDKWVHLEGGKAVHFENPQSRRVRLDINAPSKVQLTYADTEGLLIHLATVEGRDTLEFASGGEFSIISDGDCWLYTVDGEDFSFSIPDAVVLTKLVERRARNPELELMQHMMNRNIQARMDQQREELEQLWNRREAALRAAPLVAAPAGADKPAGGEPVPAPAPGGDGGSPAPAGGSAKPAAAGG